MKAIIQLVGIFLIVIGIASLGYQGITYTEHEKVAQIGTIEVTADTQKSINFSPIFGAAAFVGGIILIVIARKTRK